MIKEQKLALDRISSKLDSEEGKRRYCSFTKEERVEAEQCECDVIADIFQKAIKRKGLTKEQVRSINKEMLEEVREERK